METAKVVYEIVGGPSLFDLAVSMFRQKPGDDIYFTIVEPQDSPVSFHGNLRLQARILGADAPGQDDNWHLRGFVEYPGGYYKPFEAKFSINSRKGELIIDTGIPDLEKSETKSSLPDFQKFVGGTLLCKTFSDVPGVGKKWFYGKIEAIVSVREGGVAFKLAHWPRVLNEKHPRPRECRVAEPFWVPTEDEDIEIINLDFIPTPACLIINEKTGDTTFIFGPEKK